MKNLKITLFCLLNLFVINNTLAQEAQGDITLDNQTESIRFRALDGTAQTRIFKANGNALKFNYDFNNIHFNALTNNAIQINDQSGLKQIQLHPAGNSYFLGGNFGIGTNDPETDLHINDDNAHSSLRLSGKFPLIQLRDLNFSATQGWNLENGRNVPGVFGIYGEGVGTRLSLNRLGYLGLGVNDAVQEFVIKSSRPNIVLSEIDGNAGVIEYNEVDNQLRFQHYTNEGGNHVRTMMSLNTSDGKIGIGTTTPQAQLHLGGNISSFQIGDSSDPTGNFHWSNGTSPIRALRLWNGNNGSGSHIMSITPDGKMGLGTKEPNAKLDIAASGDGAEVLRLSTERPWVFKQQDTGSTSSLVLKSETGGDKFFRIKDYDNEEAFKIGAKSGDSYFKGNMGIGTTSTFGYKLAVNGSIGAKEVNVEVTSAWPDYVFKPDYQLSTLEDVKKHIDEKGHLPNIPSAQEVDENGISLGEMNRLLLEKVEELTLYILNQEERIQKLEANQSR